MIYFKDFMDLVNMDTQIHIHDSEGDFIGITSPKHYKNDNLESEVIFFKAIDDNQMEVWVKNYKKQGGVL